MFQMAEEKQTNKLGAIQLEITHDQVTLKSDSVIASKQGHRVNPCRQCWSRLGFHQETQQQLPSADLIWPLYGPPVYLLPAELLFLCVVPPVQSGVNVFVGGAQLPGRLTKLVSRIFCLKAARRSQLTKGTLTKGIFIHSAVVVLALVAPTGYRCISRCPPNGSLLSSDAKILACFNSSQCLALPHSFIWLLSYSLFYYCEKTP